MIISLLIIKCKKKKKIVWELRIILSEENFKFSSNIIYKYGRLSRAEGCCIIYLARSVISTITYK